MDDDDEAPVLLAGGLAADPPAEDVTYASPRPCSAGRVRPWSAGVRRPLSAVSRTSTKFTAATSISFRSVLPFGVEEGGCRRRGVHQGVLRKGRWEVRSVRTHPCYVPADQYHIGCPYPRLKRAVEVADPTTLTLSEARCLLEGVEHSQSSLFHTGYWEPTARMRDYMASNVPEEPARTSAPETSSVPDHPLQPATGCSTGSRSHSFSGIVAAASFVRGLGTPGAGLVQRKNTSGALKRCATQQGGFRKPLSVDVERGGVAFGGLPSPTFSIQSIGSSRRSSVLESVHVKSPRMRSRRVTPDVPQEENVGLLGTAPVQRLNLRGDDVYDVFAEYAADGFTAVRRGPPFSTVAAQTQFLNDLIRNGGVPPNPALSRQRAATGSPDPPPSLPLSPRSLKSPLLFNLTPNLSFFQNPVSPTSRSTLAKHRGLSKARLTKHHTDIAAELDGLAKLGGGMFPKKQRKKKMDTVARGITAFLHGNEGSSSGSDSNIGSSADMTIRRKRVPAGARKQPHPIRSTTLVLQEKMERDGAVQDEILRRHGEREARRLAAEQVRAKLRRDKYAEAQAAAWIQLLAVLPAYHFAARLLVERSFVNMKKFLLPMILLVARRKKAQKIQRALAEELAAKGVVIPPVTTDTLKQIPVFSSWPRDLLQQLAGYVRVLVYRPHQVIIHENEPMCTLLVVVCGNVIVESSGEVVRLGQVIGEASALGDSRRRERSRCVAGDELTACYVLTSGDILRAAFLLPPASRKAMVQAATTSLQKSLRLTSPLKEAMLRTHPLLRCWPDDLLSCFKTCATATTFNRHEKIFRRGEESIGFHVVVNGESTDSNTVLGFDESLFLHVPYASEPTVTSDVLETWFVRKEDVVDILKGHVTLFYEMKEAARERLCNASPIPPVEVICSFLNHLSLPKPALRERKVRDSMQSIANQIASMCTTMLLDGAETLFEAHHNVLYSYLVVEGCMVAHSTGESVAPHTWIVGKGRWKDSMKAVHGSYLWALPYQSQDRLTNTLAEALS